MIPKIPLSILTPISPNISYMAIIKFELLLFKRQFHFKIDVRRNRSPINIPNKYGIFLYNLLNSTYIIIILYLSIKAKFFNFQISIMHSKQNFIYLKIFNFVNFFIVIFQPHATGGQCQRSIQKYSDRQKCKYKN